MYYYVLARKWRPKIFEDVIGQKHIINTIANSFALDKIHHAYLLFGTRGVGKTTVARLFAKGLSCIKGITISPCGKCKNCIDIEHGCFIDLIEIDAASRTGVEDIRDILDNLQYIPVRGNFKIYLIDEIHMLSRHSFNALLKSLEEPPQHVKFILLTTERHKIPITVLSRCLQLHFKSLDVSQIFNHLQFILNKENIEYDSYVLRLLAYTANGSLRDALTLVDQAIVLGSNKITIDVAAQMFGLSNFMQPLLLLEALIHADGYNVMKKIEECAISGIDWEFLLVEMMSLLQKLAIDQVLPKINDDLNPNGEDYIILQHLRSLGQHITPTDLQLLYQILLNGRQELPFAPSYRMGVEMTLLRALAFHPIVSDDCFKECSIDSINSKIISNKLNNNEKKNYNDKLNETNSSSSNDLNEKFVFFQQKDSSFTTLSKVPCKSLLDDNNEILSEDTISLLKAKAMLEQCKKDIKLNKNQKCSQLPLVNRQKSITNIIERFSDINKRFFKKKNDDIAQHGSSSISVLSNSSNIHDVNFDQFSLENIKIILKDLMKEVITYDPWSFKIYQLLLLKLSKSAQLLAMHSWKESIHEREICLNLRSKYHYLNSKSTLIELQEMLNKDSNFIIKLIVKLNDDLSMRTPMEWCQYIYQHKLLPTKSIMLKDSNIEKLKKFFDIELDSVNKE